MSLPPDPLCARRFVGGMGNARSMPRPGLAVVTGFMEGQLAVL
jgi:hypothetical protein